MNRRFPVLAGVTVMIAFALVSAALAESPAPPPDLPGSSMAIPWSDFQKILEKLGGTVPLPPPPPPQDALVTHADWVAEVSGDGATLKGSIGLTMLKTDGWATVPILYRQAAILDAKLDGKSVSLMDSGGQWAVALREPGEHTLTLVIEAAVEDTGGPKRFSVPVVLSPVNRMEVRIPEPDLSVRFSSGGFVRARNEGAKTVAVGAFPQTDTLSVDWSRKVEKTQKEDARIKVETRTLVTVAEGLAVYTVALDYDIQHKPVGRFRIAVPKDVVVADVTTNGLVQWKTEDGEGGQVVEVELAYEAAGRHWIALTLEQALAVTPSLEFQTADIRPLDAVHETGFLGIAVRGQAQVSTSSSDNMAPLDVRELPGDLHGGPDQTALFGFKYVKHPATAKLAVERHEDASVLTCAVENADYRVMLTTGGKEIIEATYRVANRSRQFLSVTLPKGADLWSTFRDGTPVKAGVKDGTLLVPVVGVRGAETTELRITYFRQGSFPKLGGFRGFELPVLDVPTNRVNVTAFLPRSYRYLHFGGTLDRETGRLGPEKPMDNLDSDGAREDRNNWGDDKTKGDNGKKESKDILDYRAQQTILEQSVVNAPVQTDNAAYAGSLARGALPVNVQLAWDGALYQFSARIVDPGESPSLSAVYVRRWSSSLASFAVFLLALYAGYVLGCALLRRRWARIGESRLNARRDAFIAAVAACGIGVFTGSGWRDLASIAFVGALCAVARLLWIELMELRRQRLMKKESAPVSNPEGGEA